MKNGKHVTLTITESCNLNCVYCYEHYKNNKHMSFSDAKLILENELRNNNDFDYVEVSFHGGEPLLEFDLIKKICEWTWAQEFDCKYYFFITTNGTVLEDKMKEWFSVNKDRIMLGLSLDGTPEVHNYNRSDSYDKIDLGFFTELWPNQPVKMTISDNTISSLSESIIHLHNLGFRVSANFAFGIDWSKIDLDLLDDELEQLVEYYINNPTIEPTTLINQKFENINSNFRRWCGAGTSMKVYSTEGDLFPCHYFMGFAIGEIKSQESIYIDFKNGNSLADKNCEGCKLYPICPTCYGYNYASTGDPSQRDRNLCVLTKHCIAAGSYLTYLRLNKLSDEILKIDNNTRARILNGISVVQEYLFKND